jgi:hypothetical protein
MSWRSVRFASVLAAAALFFLAPHTLAGEHVRSGPGWSAAMRSHTTYSPSPVRPITVARAAPQPVVIAVLATTPVPGAKQPFVVDLRGPDGSTRRFAVEGGRAAIQTQTVVLRPGESVTIQSVAAK